MVALAWWRVECNGCPNVKWARIGVALDALREALHLRGWQTFAGPEGPDTVDYCPRCMTVAVDKLSISQHGAVGNQEENQQ